MSKTSVVRSLEDPMVTVRTYTARKVLMMFMLSFATFCMFVSFTSQFFR